MRGGGWQREADMALQTLTRRVQKTIANPTPHAPRRLPITQPSTSQPTRLQPTFLQTCLELLEGGATLRTFQRIINLFGCKIVI